jgi:hypothetical protein
MYELVLRHSTHNAGALRETQEPLRGIGIILFWMPSDGYLSVLWMIKPLVNF